MSLTPPVTVEKLQTTLHTKAKNSPDYRFYALYDKLYRRDILEWALVRCRNNRGAPEVDGQSFADIETYGRDRWLDELTEELRSGTYRPRPVRRVYIPKGTSAGPGGLLQSKPTSRNSLRCSATRVFCFPRLSRLATLVLQAVPDAS